MWRKVVFASECDEDGNCPHCGINFADCDCPGPTMEHYEYKEIDGVLYGQAIKGVALRWKATDPRKYGNNT